MATLRRRSGFQPQTRLSYRNLFSGSARSNASLSFIFRCRACHFGFPQYHSAACSRQCGSRREYLCHARYLFFLLSFALLLQGIECSSDPLPFLRTKIDLV